VTGRQGPQRRNWNNKVRRRLLWRPEGRGQKRSRIEENQYQVFDADKEMLVWLHTILSNVKALIAGTVHGLDEKHMQRYFDEICYRFNRRFIQPLLFDRLLFAVSSTPPLGLRRLTLQRAKQNRDRLTG
jgi:hypothetical protein